MLSVACKKWAAMSIEFALIWESCCAAVLLVEYTLAATVADTSTTTSPTSAATSTVAAVTTDTTTSTSTSGAEVYTPLRRYRHLPTCK